MKQIISTQHAPRAIGPYSQAVKSGNTVYISGQIGLDPETMTLVSDDFAAQAHQTFRNLQAVAVAAGGDLAHVVKLTIYLLDMQEFSLINEIMVQYFQKPYPARAAIAVVQLPKDALVEVEAIMTLGE